MNRPVVAALAVVVRDAQVLLVRRRNPPDAGIWGYPGGKVDLGEPIAQAAQRELFEETGVVARAGQTLEGLDLILSDDDGQIAHHFYLVPVVCHYDHGDPIAQDDALEARWIPVQDVLGAALPLSSGVAQVLRRSGLCEDVK
ncbi:MAG: NUDIX hydrolase [Pelagimonas sp.]|jgi:ADP-ribose pyrophosphatase YjhB (NUDIX family)|nr:NUDIX hydrolase [Pelagimonas sp.]